MKPAARITLPIVVLLLVAAIAYWLRRRTPVAPAAPAATAAVLYWYDPMLPEQHFDKPGLSPMGMQMVPRRAGGEVASDGPRIDPATAQNLGMRTAPVMRRTLTASIDVPGTISWDLRQATTISARADGVVSRLIVRAPYTAVETGDPLFTLLSPQWNSAVAESAALEHMQSPDARALREAGRQRLTVLGLSTSDVRSMRNGGGIVVHAPQAGIVTTLEVREGQRVTTGQTLMTINGMATVWIEAALPQAAAGNVRAGDKVSVRVDAYPGQVYPGQVETLLPEIDPVTRSQRARIVLANPGHRFSAGMFAQVTVAPAAGKPVLAVPDEAIIATGEQSRVVVTDGHGHFRPVAVTAGQSADGYTAVLAGLHGDEQVVVSGQFLIDSEASLSGALERLSTPAGTLNGPPAAAASSAMPIGDEP